VKSKPILYVTINNHFDPTWRRCWRKRFTHAGQMFASYAELQEAYMLDNLALARRHAEYAFEAESAIVLREFLRRHPELRGELRALAAQGRFAVTGAGDNVIDSNMVLGESIVRNFLTGLLYVERTLGVRTKLGWRADGFGNSAQLPQILNGCELPWSYACSYSPVCGSYWRGLDGSVVVHAMPPLVAYGGGVRKLPPCAACRGAGCDACGGRGFQHLRAALPVTFHEKLEREGAGLCRIAPEEVLPDPKFMHWVQTLRRKYDVQLVVHEALCATVQDKLARAANPPADELHPGVELNPNNTGVYVTRIKTKQNCRRQEYALLGAETLCSMAALRGAAWPRADLAAAWEKLLFTMFHDAITATHVDAAYEEIRDTWAEIDALTSVLRQRALRVLATPAPREVTVLNLHGDAATQPVQLVVKGAGATVKDAAGRELPLCHARPLARGQCAIEFVARDVPAFGVQRYRVEPCEAPVVKRLRAPRISNGMLTVEADEHGVTCITHRTLGVIARRAAYRVGELIYEHDEGSPWATLHPDMTRTPLAGCTRLVAVESCAGSQRLVFETRGTNQHGFGGRQFRATTAVVVRTGLDRVDFRLSVEWAEFNHRVRVAFPTPVRGRHYYGIPYGMLERKPYQPVFSWTGANGDWPAINWAGIQGRTVSVALLNKGLPSYKVEPHGRGQCILLSVLRSPAIPTYLHEPEYYTMTGYDGMRDEGQHEFDFALQAYGTAFADSSVVADSETYNSGLLAVQGRVHCPALPVIESSNVRISAVKWAESGNALIVRVQEYRGRSGHARVSIPAGVRRVQKVNLLERAGEDLPVTDGSVTLELGPWKLATLRMSMSATSKKRA